MKYPTENVHISAVDRLRGDKVMSHKRYAFPDFVIDWYLFLCGLDYRFEVLDYE